ncbi:MAG: SpoIIE family protein phosphatase [Oscillospiraceae bacterium]|nr:SpoIIE family protein phosphatase [Oscillospiraceae bacterium]
MVIRMNKSPMRKKVFAIIVRVSLIAVVVFVVVVMAGLYVLRDNIVNIVDDMSNMASAESKMALEDRMRTSLMTLAENMAALSDAELLSVQNSVEMISDAAGDILRNPGAFMPNPVAPPNAADKDIMTAQFLVAEGVDLLSIADDAARMGNIQGLLLNIIRNNVNATSNYVGSEQGYTIIVDESSDKKPEYSDPRERPWYTRAVQNNGLIWSDVFLDLYGRGLSITCAKPYYDENGQIAGVVGVGTLLDELTQLVIGTKVGETGYSFMLDELGQIIISDEMEFSADGSIVRKDLLNGDNADLAAVALNMIAGKSGFERIHIDGKEYFIAYAALKTTPWSLATVIEVEEANAPAIEIENRMSDMKNNAKGDVDFMVIIIGGVFAVSVILIVLLVDYLSRRFSAHLTAPIISLWEGIRQIASGNLNHVIDIRSGDEVENLGSEINKMSLELKNHIDNLTKITGEKERLGAELDVARKIQSSMLPCIFPAFPDMNEFDIYAMMEPAKEVGGDFYDFFLVDESHLAVVMADVSGKGVPAALFMVIAKTLIKNNAQYGKSSKEVLEAVNDQTEKERRKHRLKSPKEVFETVNDILCENNDENMFVTAFMGYLNIKTGKFVYVNAGHEPPIIKSKDGKCEHLHTEPGFVLAVMNGMKYEQGEIDLSSGDMIYFYTDGVTEAVNRKMELFSTERLLKVCEKFGSLPPKEFLMKVKKKIDDFANGAEKADDITMLSLLIKSGGDKTESSEGEESLYDSVLNVAADIQQLQKVTEFVLTEAQSHNPDCSEEDKFSIALAVEEIFVNIASYAYAKQESELNKVGDVTIRTRVDGGFVIEFEDSGIPYNPLEKSPPDVNLPLEEREIGGLGLFLVRDMMNKTEYEYKNGKNIFTIMKKI